MTSRSDKLRRARAITTAHGMEIRAKYEAGSSTQELANEYGLTNATIWRTIYANGGTTRGHNLGVRKGLALITGTTEPPTMKDMPALLLAELSRRDPALMDRVFDRVVDSPRMLRTFVQIVRSGATGRKSLGSAPKRPWDPDRYFSWRRYWDYSGGIAGDLLVHRVTRLIKALGLTFPERACAAGGKFEFTSSAAEIPDTMNILLDYPGGPTVQLISSQANDTPVPHLIRGHKANLFLAGRISALP